MNRFLFAFVPFAFVACSSPSYETFGNGALHNGDFVYLCTTPSDAYCAGTENAHVLPDGIALGASFRLAFTAAPGEGAATLGVATDEFLVLAPDGTLSAKRTGIASVTATTASGDIADFVNLHIRQPASLSIRGADEATTMRPSETRVVRVSALDLAGGVLAGSATYEWETSDPRIIAIDVTEEDRSRGGATLRAVAPGPARVRVVFGGVTSTVDVLVGGA